MRKSSFTDEEIAQLLTEVRCGTPIERVCRDARISLRTFYRWRRRLGDLTPVAVKNLARLEEENRTLRRQVETLSRAVDSARCNAQTAKPATAPSPSATPPFALSARSTATLAGRFSMPRIGVPYDRRATLMARDLLNRCSNKSAGS